MDQAISLSRGRCFIVVAALLWSSGSFFMRLLSTPVLGLDQPELSPLQIALWRSFFAGLALVPLVPRRAMRLRPSMGGMVLVFSLMSGTYLTAMHLGSAANAILLQNTAPFWVYLIGVRCLGHPSDGRMVRAISLGLLGALVLVVGNSTFQAEGQDALVIFLALLSGLMYAAVILLINYHQEESSSWLIVLNLLGTTILLGLFSACQLGFVNFWFWLTTPTSAQLIHLAIFGTVQMSAAYYLFSRGLKVVSPQEAGIITLLEPILNPIWAYLISPATDTPTRWTWIGGLMLLAALAWRYVSWPPKPRVRVAE